MLHIFQSPFFLLFLLVAVGVGVGAWRLRGVALGSAGVFFIALLAGHLQTYLPAADQIKIPSELTELGLLLFVYSVGLQAGPRFFGVLRTKAAAFLAVGAGSTAVGALTTIGLALWFHLQPPLAAGLYCGATTCSRRWPRCSTPSGVQPRNRPRWPRSATAPRTRSASLQWCWRCKCCRACCA
jgi:putative transport protein